MKKIKYGNRDRTKQKTNRYLQELKDDDDVCGAVLDTLNADYLSYITNLVKNTKNTPPKQKQKQPKPQQRINQLFDNRGQEEKRPTIKNQPIDRKIDQNHATPKSDFSLKNTTLPMKKIKGITHGHSHREAHCSVDNKPSFNINQMEALRQHYNRFPTQQAERIERVQRNDQTSIICDSQQSQKHMIMEQNHSRNFLTELDDYLLVLGNNNTGDRKRPNSRNKNKNPDNIRDIDDILHENTKLRKKVRKYEDKIEEIQENLQTHFLHCKRKQKSQRNKINDLIRNLAQAVNKINSQKEQIDTMKELFKNFGRKARFCADNYDEESSDFEEEINQSLVKAMRPSRAHSDNKLKKKKPLQGNFENYLIERDL